MKLKGVWSCEKVRLVHQKTAGLWHYRIQCVFISELILCTYIPGLFCMNNQYQTREWSITVNLVSINMVSCINSSLIWLVFSTVKGTLSEGTICLFLRQIGKLVLTVFWHFFARSWCWWVGGWVGGLVVTHIHTFGRVLYISVCPKLSALGDLRSSKLCV